MTCWWWWVGRRAWRGCGQPPRLESTLAEEVRVPDAPLLRRRSAGAVAVAVSSLMVWTLGGCAEETSAPAMCDAAVAIAPAEPRLAVGDSLVVTAALAGRGRCAPTSVTWRTSDPAVISVDPSTGLLRAHRAGTVMLLVMGSTAVGPLDSVAVVSYAPLLDRLIFSRLPPFTGDPDDPRPVTIWTMDTAGGDLRMAVDDLHWPQHARVSPDGKTIVFEDWGELFLTDAGGGARRRLDTGVTDAFGPTWSPDGQWILFSGGSSLNPPWQAFRMKTDGSPAIQLTEYPLGTHSGDWSPEGRIVYIRYTALGLGAVHPEAVVMDTNGTTLQVLTEGLPGFGGGSPDWSPDGTSILFMDAGWNITKLTLTTMKYDTLGSAMGNRAGYWSPDGKAIVFGTGDLWTMSPDGTNRRLLLADGYENFEVSWTPARPKAP